MDKLKQIIALIVAVATPETVVAVRGAFAAAAAIGSVFKSDGTPATPDELGAIWDEAAANRQTFKSEREASMARVTADIAAGR